MEIVSVFGPLKAYHFEINKELSEPCAFLEVIHSFHLYNLVSDKCYAKRD